MARVLLVTWDGGGNVPPAVGIADEMRRRGHAVSFLGHAQQAQSLEASGYPVTAYSSTVPWSSAEPSRGLAAARRIFAMFTDKGQGADLRELLAREPADLVVVDCMMLGALDVLRRGRVPYCVLAHTYWEFVSRSWIRGPIGLIARAKGLAPTAAWAGAQRVLVAADAGLDPARRRPLPANVHHVGVVQAAPEQPQVVEADLPRVLVSLSTTYFDGQKETLQAILDAVDGLPLDAVVTTGPAVDPRDLRPPGNATVHRRLPHEQVMPGVRLVIGHGGHATTMRALAHDAPLVVLPMHPMLDQKMIGRSVVAQGAGALLSRKASAGEIRAAVEALLPVGPAHAAAARLGAALRAQPAASTAADHLEAELQDGPRVGSRAAAP